MLDFLPCPPADQFTTPGLSWGHQTLELYIDQPPSSSHTPCFTTFLRTPKHTHRLVLTHLLKTKKGGRGGIFLSF